MKIWKIALLVEDLESAEAFYKNVLGMEVTLRGPRSIYLDAGPVKLELIRLEAFEGTFHLAHVPCQATGKEVYDFSGKCNIVL